MRRLSELVVRVVSIMTAILLHVKTQLEQQPPKPKPKRSDNLAQRNGASVRVLPKDAIEANLLCGAITWNGPRGGRWHLRQHLTKDTALVPAIHRMITKLNQFSSRRELDYHEQQLLDDLRRELDELDAYGPDSGMPVG